MLVKDQVVGLGNGGPSLRSLVDLKEWSTTPGLRQGPGFFLKPAVRNLGQWAKA